MSKRINKGIVNYQNGQRQHTLKKVDDAIAYLRTKGLQITKTSVADEAGISRKTLYLDYVKIYLMAFPEFNASKENPEKNRTNEEYALEISYIKQTISNTKNANRKLRIENTELRQKNIQLNEKYKRLLGAYQNEVGNKLLRF